MTSEPMHTVSEMAPCTPTISIIVLKVKYPLCFIVGYVQPVTQHFESRTVQKAPLQSTHTERKKWCCAPSYINYCLKSEISITLRCRLCSTRYTAVQIKDCLKSTSAIKIAITKNIDDFRYKGKSSCAATKLTILLLAKMNGTQRRTLVSP